MRAGQGQRVLSAAMLASLLLAGWLSVSWAGPKYAYTDLGTLGGTWCSPLALNNRGQLVGSSETADGTEHAFLWDGIMHDLGTLGGTWSKALAINDTGQVVGVSQTSEGNTSGFIWDGEMHRLEPSAGRWVPSDVNDVGQITGSYSTASTASHGFLWDGTMRDLGTMGGTWSYCTALNNRGQVVGISETIDGGTCAFLWDGTFHGLGIQDGLMSDPMVSDINDDGLVVGSVYVDVEGSEGADGWVAVFWDPREYAADFLTPISDARNYSRAYAVNEEGDGVGTRGLEDSPAVHAYLWSGADSWDLSSPLSGCPAGFELVVAWDINDRGQVVASEFRGRGVLLSPCCSPELSTLALLGCSGLAALAMRRRRCA